MRKPTSTPRRPRDRERGIAMALALFAMTALLVAASAGMLVGASDIRATRNYRGATQVHFAAESAISEALQLINGPGVINFENEVATPWSTLWGTALRDFGPLSGFTYTVDVFATPGNAANAGWLVASASGPEGVRNTVVANVLRSNIPGTAPGAVYLASNSPTDANFNGNAFTVDGTDRNFTGGAGPGGAVPGISTRNDSNTQETIGSLSSGQADNVTGLGYLPGPPVVPSVKTSPAAPTAAQLNQMAADLIARAAQVVSADRINGNNEFGSVAAPQITYVSNTDGMTVGNGNASGAGIMIVEGDLTIQGSLEFKGLIIVRGQTRIQTSNETEITGNATLYGSIWTNDIALNVAGSALVQYSTQALALANTVGGGGALPAPVTVTSLANCAQLPAGAGGCP